MTISRAECLDYANHIMHLILHADPSTTLQVMRDADTEDLLLLVDSNSVRDIIWKALQEISGDE